MTTTDKIFYTFMFIASAVIIGLILSLTTGCAPRPGKFYPEVSTEITCIPQAGQAADPCELEFWENEQFANRKPDFQLGGD
jgi:hypothetical protein